MILATSFVADDSRCNDGEGWSVSSSLAMFSESMMYLPSGMRTAGMVYAAGLADLSFGGMPLDSVNCPGTRNFYRLRSNLL